MRLKYSSPAVWGITPPRVILLICGTFLLLAASSQCCRAGDTNLWAVASDHGLLYYHENGKPTGVEILDKGARIQCEQVKSGMCYLTYNGRPAYIKTSDLMPYEPFFAAEQKAKGLLEYDGEWVTPEEHARRKENRWVVAVDMAEAFLHDHGNPTGTVRLPAGLHIRCERYESDRCFFTYDGNPAYIKRSGLITEQEFVVAAQKAQAERERLEKARIEADRAFEKARQEAIKRVQMNVQEARERAAREAEAARLAAQEARMRAEQQAEADRLAAARREEDRRKEEALRHQRAQEELTKLQQDFQRGELSGSGDAPVDLGAIARKVRPSVMLLEAYGRAAGTGTGTGFLISSDGVLVTCRHVAMERGMVARAGEREYKVTGILAEDAAADIVLLKVEGGPFPFLPLGQSKNLDVGHRIAVVGSPLGLQDTLSEGIISAVRDVGQGRRMIQITAPISAGSSGSPVLDAKGNVVGVAQSTVAGGQSLNFAVPIEAVKNLVRNAPRKITSLETTAVQVWIDKGIESEKEALAIHDMLGKKPWLPASESDAARERARALWKKAVRDYKTALELDWKNAEANFRCGAVLHTLGEPGAAWYYLEQAVRTDPKFANAWFALGEAYRDDGGFTNTKGQRRWHETRLEQAIECFQRAAELDHRFAEKARAEIDRIDQLPRGY